MDNFKIHKIKVRPFYDQKLGTSGLRKKVKVFQQKNYTENFIQSVINSIPGGLEREELIIGGDGRFYNEEVIQLIIRIAAANGIQKLVIGKKGILSTPVCSHIIRTRKAIGGFILTASHNPGGQENDFGIKFNFRDGAPAIDKLTDKIYEETKRIDSYNIIDIDKINIDNVGKQKIGPLQIEVLDSVSIYIDMLKTIFDFPLIKLFISEGSKKGFKILFDGMNGVTSEYFKTLAIQEFGLTENNIQNCKSLPDFGGLHPDPNLTYARQLIDRVESEKISFGAASDGDGDRNMIYGHDAFVSPCDSLAIIAEYGSSIPYFKKKGFYGFARSMPTSSAIDLVAKSKNLKVYEVPTGWKYFCSLFETKKVNLCGEESFGTGSDHIREKDGIWAVVAWLNILADLQKKSNNLVSIKSVQEQFWVKYGRTFFLRHDYENISNEKASDLISYSKKLIESKKVNDSLLINYVIKDLGDFSYTDSDGHVSKNNGLYMRFENKFRFVIRLSGTGSSNSTIRLYFERHSDDRSLIHLSSSEYLKKDIDFALNLIKLKDFILKDRPDVVT